jgi:hypothetical protein
VRKASTKRLDMASGSRPRRLSQELRSGHAPQEVAPTPRIMYLPFASFACACDEVAKKTRKAAVIARRFIVSSPNKDRQMPICGRWRSVEHKVVERRDVKCRISSECRQLGIDAFDLGSVVLDQ